MSTPEPETGPRPTPNVLIILTDDLGWADTGCYGATAIPTPAIDELAAQGLRCTDAHGASAVCTPSRYALMTGRYPWRSPLQAGVLGGFDPPLIDTARPTVARAFSDAGYATGYFGKWHLGLSWTRRDGQRGDTVARPGITGDLNDAGRDVDYAAGFAGGPTELGFDTFFGIAGSFDMAPYCFLEDDHTVGIPDREKDVIDDHGQRPGLTVEGWQDDQADLIMVDRAVDWVGEQVRTDRPFFATVGTLSPHRPCVPPAEFHGRSAAGRRGDSVVLVDELVRRLRQAVAPVAENTIVIFTSDNGAPMNYPEDGDTFAHRPNGSWRGQKADIWEGGHRIPMIISGPGVSADAETDATVSLLDLFPTLLDVAGIEVGRDVRESLDGRSFAAQLTDPEAVPSQPRILGIQALNGMLALRYGTRKAVFGTGSGGFTELKGSPDLRSDGDGQLYDLADDPGELRNRWRQDRDEAQARLVEFDALTGFRATVDAAKPSE